ncbi:MAG: adenine phosphoribosyltransferase [Hyphomonadaceae bacterium]
MDIRKTVRTIPDHPKAGIMFRDITTLLGDAAAFRHAVDAMALPYRNAPIDKVAAIEARGFVFGGAIAHILKVGFAPVRKKGKLPWRTVAQEYALEYGVDVVEMHEDAVKPGERVLLVDDLIATGGTAEAAVALLESLGATLAGASFVIDLPELGGAEKLRARGIVVESLCAFEGH